jgi:hypothetical protein
VTTTRTLEQDIEDAKITLDGARQIREAYPTAMNQDTVDSCEQRMNRLLDQYPRTATERNQ